MANTKQIPMQCTFAQQVTQPPFLVSRPLYDRPPSAPPPVPPKKTVGIWSIPQPSPVVPLDPGYGTGVQQPPSPAPYPPPGAGSANNFHWLALPPAPYPHPGQPGVNNNIDPITGLPTTTPPSQPYGTPPPSTPAPPTQPPAPTPGGGTSGTAQPVPTPSPGQPAPSPAPTTGGAPTGPAPPANQPTGATGNSAGYPGTLPGAYVPPQSAPIDSQDNGQVASNTSITPDTVYGRDPTLSQELANYLGNQSMRGADLHWWLNQTSRPGFSMYSPANFAQAIPQMAAAVGSAQAAAPNIALQHGIADANQLLQGQVAREQEGQRLADLGFQLSDLYAANDLRQQQQLLQTLMTLMGL